MRKILILALVLLAAGLLGAARASADSSSSVSLWAEAGDGTQAPIDQNASDNEPGGTASASWGWPLPSFPVGMACPSTGCADRSAGASASTDEAAGTLRASAAASVLVGNAPSANYGADAYVTSNAEIDDTITLSQPATVLLEGTVHGSMAADNADDYWANNPTNIGASLSIDFQNGGGPIFRASSLAQGATGYDASYTPDVRVGCHDAADSCSGGIVGGVVPQPIDDTFSVPVDLPAGETPISAKLAETVSLLVDGEAGVVLSQDGLLDLGDTVTFHIVVPPGVVATSGSGELPLVGGAPADSTPPTSTASVVPAANAAGWNSGPVTVSLAATDSGSGVASLVYGATGAGAVPETTAAGDSVSLPVAAEGVTTITYHAVDAAGNAEAPQTLTVRIDERPPSLSLPAGGVTADATGPDGAAVSYTASAQDALDPAPSLDCTPASGSSFAIGTTTVDCTAADAAGNSSSGSFTVTVRGAAAQLADLVDATVKAVRLPALSAGLETHLQTAASALLSHPRLACNALRAYATGIRALSGHLVSAADAAALEADVRRIEAVAGC